MFESNSIAEIAAIIQLAVAPVFLLAGVAGFLGVLSSRLGRITDRARVVESRLLRAPADQCAILKRESRILWQRIDLINGAIRLCTSAALLVCLVIATLFAGTYVSYNLNSLVGLLFIGAMLLLLSGLIFFLREIGIATHTMKSSIEVLASSSEREP